LRYQQNLKGRRLAILLLPTNRLKVLQKMTVDIEAAIAFVVPGEPDQYIELFAACGVTLCEHTSGPVGHKGKNQINRIEIKISNVGGNYLRWRARLRPRGSQQDDVAAGRQSS